MLIRPPWLYVANNLSALQTFELVLSFIDQNGYLDVREHSLWRAGFRD